MYITRSNILTLRWIFTWKGQWHSVHSRTFFASCTFICLASCSFVLHFLGHRLQSWFEPWSQRYRAKQTLQYETKQGSKYTSYHTSFEKIRNSIYRCHCHCIQKTLPLPLKSLSFLPSSQTTINHSSIQRAYMSFMKAWTQIWRDKSI